MNTLTHNYVLEEWKEIYPLSLKSKTKEINATAISFP